MTTTKATTAAHRTGVVLYDDTGRCRTHVAHTTDPDVARGRALRKWFGPKARWYDRRPFDGLPVRNGRFGEVVVTQSLRRQSRTGSAAWCRAVVRAAWVDTFPLLPDGTIPSATTTEEETES